MPSSLLLRAGPDALRLVRERGLRAGDVDVVAAASGGPKWLAIAGMDRWLFGELLAATRERPMHLIGSSIGSWRMACLAQREPLAALARGHHAYVYDQRYSARPSPADVSRVLGAVLDTLLGPTGAEEILAHPWARLHVVTAEGRGLARSGRRAALMLSLGIAAAANLVSRRTLGLQLRRAVFHSAGDATPFAHLADLPTVHHRLTSENLRAALLASGSIPLVLEGVAIPGTARGSVYWDGGVLDYHPDLDWGEGRGLVLYPHFYPHVVPGWFDKSLGWRRARGANFRRVLLVTPSPEWVAALPGGRIPDRRDFYRMPEAERFRRWQRVIEESDRLGDELAELVSSGRIADAIRPW